MIGARSFKWREAAPLKFTVNSHTWRQCDPPTSSPPRCGQRRLGFSLTELMVSLLLASVIMSGVAATFSQMRTSAGDQARTAEVYSGVRGLNVQLHHDFSNAGRGLWDMSAYNIRYNFVDSFVSGTGLPRYFYGVTDHDVDGVSGQSTIVLQWWDYDVVGESSSKSPTFLFDLGSGASFPPDGVFSTAYLVGPSNYLAEISAGDIFLIHGNRARATTSAYNQIEGEATEAVWNHADVGALPEPTNTAVLLEVSRVGGVALTGDPAYGNLSQVQVDFTATADSYFSNDLEGDSMVFPFQRPASFADREAWGNLDNMVYARKLGHRDNFHRVRYLVDNTGKYPVLTRIHNNDNPEIILSNISDFSVYIGLDVSPGILPTTTLIRDMDGTVNGTADALWALNHTDYSASYDDYQTLIGRHAMAANVTIAAESTNETSKGYRPKASFNSRFRVNTGLPQPINNKAKNAIQ